MEALEQHRIIEILNFRVFEQCEPGWTRWDLRVDNLWVDNILFHSETNE